METHVIAPMELSLTSGHPGLMPVLHSHKEVEINLVEAGTMTYMFGGSHVVVPAGQLAVFWATIPHRVIRTTPDAHFYCINLALSCFLRWQLPPDFTNRLLRGEMILEPDRAHEELDRHLFTHWRADLASNAQDSLNIVELEIHARLMRLAQSTATGQQVKAESSALPGTRQNMDKVEQIAMLIGERYREPLSIDDIGAVVGLHPKYAATLFKKHCGMTIGEYLTEQRISQAKRLLATTDNKIVDVAFEAGFNSVSRFYEVFEQTCGQTPKSYRASLFGAPAPLPAPRIAPDYSGCNIT
ncbi:MAG: helix-turn-helix domain-containing protein [Capsulimonadaceae bacterium]|nr:helix-turn-helix domain-containing protein [Capsulimonadaceae bacterium]